MVAHQTFSTFGMKRRSGRTDGKGAILSGVSNCLRRQYEELPALTLGESLLLFLTKKTHLFLSAQIQDTKVKLLTKCKG